MRCLNLWGHKWSRWESVLTKPQKGKDGRYYRNQLQTRGCKRCGFINTVFTNVAEFCPDINENDKS